MAFSWRQGLLRLVAVSMLAFPGLPFAESPAETHLRLELISEQATAPPGQPLWVGLLFRIEPGWHIYWQNPGDSGEPPKVEWELPQGFSAGSIRWPQPIRLGSGSIIDYGYEGQVLLMAPIAGQSVPGARAAPPLSADVKYIVCRDVCIPGKAHLALSGSPGTDWAARRALFEQTRRQLPKPTPAGWKVTAFSDKQHFILSVRGQAQLSSASFFPLEPSQIENSSPQEFAGTRAGFRLVLRKSEQLTKPLPSLRGLIVLGPGQAFEIAAPVAGQLRE